MVAILGGPTKGNVGLVAGLGVLDLDARLVSPRCSSKCLSEQDTAIGRLDVRSTLDGVEPGLLDLLWLERSGIRVLNTSRALLAAHDKLRTWRLLARAGVPQPRTTHVRDEERLRAVGLPVVIKPRFGSWGRDVMRCGNARELDSCVAIVRERTWFRRHGAIAQELLPQRGRDLRLLVAAGAVVGAAERVAAPGEWRTNVSLGGTTRSVTTPEAADGLAVAAAEAAEVDFVGVDLLLDEFGRWLVLELNGAVDFDARYSLAGEDVYERLADALELRRVAVRSLLHLPGTPAPYP